MISVGSGKNILTNQINYFSIIYIFGAWLSLVEHLAWDQGVAGSNPAAPTIFISMNASVAQLDRATAF